MESICEIKEIYKSLYLFEKKFLETNGITINEALVLCCLKKSVSQTANEICKYIGLSNSRISRIINTVEEKGYISRKLGSEDKRQMIFELTPQGEEKVKIMQANQISFKDFLKIIKLKS
ncbi:MAG: winged helix DNA-binding protein [Flavobacteriaceae bacterium]|jgi:DNA-binding MarR family transcriptional regulator|nr:winged helix DNA-binding protein [Flavobacteriaceae bacterium]